MRVLDHTRFASLVHAIDTVAQAREPTEALEALIRIVVPAHADFCSLDLAIDERRFVQAIGVRGETMQTTPFTRVFSADDRVPLVVREVTAAGHARTIEAPGEQVLRAYARDPEVERLLADPPCHALVVAPLGLDNRRVGAITLGFHTNVPLQPDIAMQDLLRLVVVLVAQVSRATQAMEHARDVEKRANDVLAIVSHELKSPLGAVRAAASLLQRTDLHPIAPRRLAGLSHTVLAAADRMARLVGDLQELARANDAELTVDLAPHDLDALVSEVIDAMAPLALSKGVVLKTTTTAAKVLCDRDRI
jgi:signal transduction histidine kinase